MTDKKRHVVIVMPDQWRADCFSGVGHPVVKTPVVDGLMKEGVRFERAYTNCPICMPARASFLSGLYCHNHGQWWNYGQLPTNVDTYARRLRDAGYRTCHVGKSHLYEHSRGHHLDEYKTKLNEWGFEDVFEVTGPLATKFTNSIMTDRWEKLGILKMFREDYFKRQDAGVKAVWPSPMPSGETLDDFVGRTAVEYVKGYQDQKPMMLFVGFPGPHDPWDPPKDWAAKYEGVKMNEAKGVTEPGAWVPPVAAEHQRKLQRIHPDMTPEIVAKTRQLYYAKISHIDDWVGKIVESLKRKGMWEDTVLIFWSDHGEMLWDKGRLHKAVFYEESARVPLVIRTPETAKRGGKVSRGLVSLMDVWPTILELAGCEAKKEAFGTSLAPVLEKPESVVNDAVFSEIGEGENPVGVPEEGRRTMIRDERYKMVVNREGEVLKLYDMLEDAKEEENLVGKKGMEEVERRLKERMLRWLLETPNTG